VEDQIFCALSALGFQLKILLIVRNSFSKEVLNNLPIDLLLKIVEISLRDLLDNEMKKFLLLISVILFAVA
jgi:hypothetical protein